MNSNEQKKRTSFSVDKRTFDALKRASKMCKYKEHELAVLVIKLMVRRLKFNRDECHGVKYNDNICKSKVYPYLNPEEYFSLRQVRALYGVSISLLLCHAVMLFLAALIFKLLHNYAESPDWLIKISKYLNQTRFTKKKSTFWESCYSISFSWIGGDP